MKYYARINPMGCCNTHQVFAFADGKTRGSYCDSTDAVPVLKKDIPRYIDGGTPFGGWSLQIMPPMCEGNAPAGAIGEIGLHYNGMFEPLF